MILADTSVWIAHLRNALPTLAERLEATEIACHAFVIGELACGQLRDRATLLEALRDLPEVPNALDAEVLLLIDRHRLMGTGIGYVDAHLLAAVLLAPGTRLWTLDRRLAAAAARLGVAANP